MPNNSFWHSKGSSIKTEERIYIPEGIYYRKSEIYFENY